MKMNMKMLGSGLVVAFGLALLSPSLAHAVSQQLDCGMGGKQTMEFSAVAPAAVSVGSTFTVQIGGDTAKPVKVSGSAIKNMTWYFPMPAGVTIVNGPVVKNVGKQGTVVSGKGTLGTISVSVRNGVIVLSATGPVDDGNVFVPPGFSVDVKSTTVGELSFHPAASPTIGYTAGALSISCKSVLPLVDLAKVKVG